MKRILITGSAGFAGKHLVDHILAYTDWEIIGLDSFKHRGDSVRVTQGHEVTGESLKASIFDRYKVFCCDLNAPISRRLLQKIGSVDYIVNMASESHVDRSIEDPVGFVKNNVNIALHVLDAARDYLKPNGKFIQISTDEVYGPALEGTDHVEWSPMLPSNPYSASKEAQEAIAISFWRTYGIPVYITNTMNMFGEMQDREKFIPLCISKIIKGDMVTVHGNKNYIGKRKYLHGRNHADALLFILKNVPVANYIDCLDQVSRPQRLNIVGDVEMDNLTLAKEIASILKKPLMYTLQDFHAITARPGHDRRYSLDGSKIKSLGWSAPVKFDKSLENTVKWYLDNPEWL